MINLKKDDAVADAIREILQQEALKGDQHKIDANKNNKIDSHDFKLLRGKKKDVDEEVKDEYARKVNKYLKNKHAPDAPVKEEVEVVYEANIEPTSAKSRSHIGNLSNPITNTVVHPSSGKEIGIITKQPSGEYYAHHSAAKLSHAESGTFDTKDQAHQFIRNAHAKAIKSDTLSDRFMKKEEVVMEGRPPTSQMDTPFVTDGENKPLGNAKELAAKTMKRMKNEMLGKTGTSE